jgi:hypothetical protein
VKSRGLGEALTALLALLLKKKQKSQHGNKILDYYLGAASSYC